MGDGPIYINPGRVWLADRGDGEAAVFAESRSPTPPTLLPVVPKGDTRPPKWKLSRSVLEVIRGAQRADRQADVILEDLEDDEDLPSGE